MFDLTKNVTLLKTLACVALQPGLRSLLIFDAPYDGLRQIAGLLEPLLQATTSQRVQRYNFGPFESDDDIWGSLPVLPGRQPVRRLFSPERNEQELQLLTIANLSILSLSAARSCIMIIGSDVVHLERNGEKEHWHPQQCWIAGCPQDEIGAVSPHLLDRFSLRLSWEDISSSPIQNNATRIHEIMVNVPLQMVNETSFVPPKYIKSVASALYRKVTIHPQAYERMLDYVPLMNYYPRREITLSRLALALAQYEGVGQLSVAHVDEAASVLGMAERGDMLDDDSHLDDEEPLADDKDIEVESLVSHAHPEKLVELPLNRDHPANDVAQLPAAVYNELLDSAPLCHDPYPEDNAPIEREAASLTLPFTSYASNRTAHGPILGVQESDSLYDLAIVSTILAALKRQRINSSPTEHKRIVFDRSDLRRYRRGAISEHLLMLLIDYTSMRNIVAWQDALIEPFREAYVRRAQIVIIKVGARRAQAIDELQAEIVTAKNILVPRVSTALETQHGKATPLAHGLNLAVERLHHVLQHGRSTIHHVTFIVLSDGRGNVPLRMSLSKRVNHIVTHEGIDDALQVARQINAINRVDTIVFDPETQYYPDLPARLANELGAILYTFHTSTQDVESSSDVS